jgi:hypothetical protein
MVKMKVTTEGERVINLLWDVIAAKGFEKSMYFEQAAVDIRALPKLEGTVHVNIALIVKFMPSFFFAPAECPEVPRRDDAADDTFLFHQGPARGLGNIRFHDYRRAFALFDMLNPFTHGATPEQVAAYKVEPYVVAADVYAASGQLGRGGWTWYTGSASWMYRVALESIVGFTKRGDRLALDPCVPREWTEFSVEYRYGGTPYTITVRNPDRVSRGVASVTVDGASVEGGVVPLVDDGRRREVVVTMGATGAR